MIERTVIIAASEAVMHFGKQYVYRIASVNVNKVTLEKYVFEMSRNLDEKSYSFKLNDDTFVGSVQQKVNDNILDAITLGVDDIIVDLSVKNGEIIGIVGIKRMK